MPQTILPEQESQRLLEDFFEQHPEVNLVGLSTADGFNIHTVARIDNIPDKIAALTSTMCAMGEAVAEHLLAGDVSSVVIEAAQGDILFLKIPGKERNRVLAAAFTRKMSLGEARFLTKRLAGSV